MQPPILNLEVYGKPTNGVILVTHVAGQKDRELL